MGSVRILSYDLLDYPASSPRNTFAASDTVIISVIGSIGEAMNPQSS